MRTQFDRSDSDRRVNAGMAIRAALRGRVQGVGFRDATVARAHELGALGWVRNGDDGSVLVHAEGPQAAIDALVVLRRARGFELQLEVGGAMRAWAVPKEPSMDPVVKRFAIAVSPSEAADATSVWDRGIYEQGGRVAWPEALERGHAVFVLRGEQLRGGFALQRTRAGARPQWLLVKRRDEHARPGSDA